MTATQATTNKDLFPSVPVVFCVNSENRVLAIAVHYYVNLNGVELHRKAFHIAIPSGEKLAGTTFSSTIPSVSAVIKL